MLTTLTGLPPLLWAGWQESCSQRFLVMVQEAPAPSGKAAVSLRGCVRGWNHSLALFRPCAHTALRRLCPEPASEGLEGGR